MPDHTHPAVSPSRWTRDAYRRGLGIEPHQRLVAVASSAQRHSLWAHHPTLAEHLLEELPMDQFRVVLLPDPGILSVHGDMTMLMHAHLQNGPLVRNVLSAAGRNGESMTLTDEEFHDRFRAVDPAPTITVALATQEWIWLDGFAARTGTASRAKAFETAMWCGVERVNRLQREFDRRHYGGRESGRDRRREPWYFAEAFASLPVAEAEADPGATVELTVEAGLQAKFGQFTDLAELHSPAVARRLFLAGREGAETDATERGFGPTFASVFPEVETLDPAQSRQVVQATTDEVLAHVVTDPPYAAITAFRARGYYLAIVEFTANPERWYHPVYCAAADSEEAIMRYCGGHEGACYEETGLEFYDAR